MEFFRIKRVIPFMKHALVFNVISLVTFALAVFFLATRGLNLVKSSILVGEDGLKIFPVRFEG